MYRNEYKVSCLDLKKKTYCLGEILRRGGGDCVLLWGGLVFWIWIFVYLYFFCIYVFYIWGLNLDRNIYFLVVLKICLYMLYSIYVVGFC